MPKITLIGAGSTVFAKHVLSDILTYPELRQSHLVLHDINQQRLDDSLRVLQRVCSRLKVHTKIDSTLNRRDALRNSDYVIGMFQIGGYHPSTVIDFEIPRKFGLSQTIGDTLGIGGIMRGLRTIVALEGMLRDMEELCPHALFINYVNPMAINMWATFRLSPIRAIGLCHSVRHTARQLSADLRVPYEEVNYLVAGINHMAFFLKLEHSGEDLYPALRKFHKSGQVPEWNRVRYDLFNRLGYFVTESSEHLAEYVPWYIQSRRPELIDKFNIPIDEYLGRCEAQLQTWKFLQKEIANPGTVTELDIREAIKDIQIMPKMRSYYANSLKGLHTVARSEEYAGEIIHSIETNTPRIIYGNVKNEGCIENLPNECCVELPCLVDGNGIQPTKIGKIPLQLAALMQTNINVQELTVEAALTKNREHIYHAAMLDPHTGAEMDLDSIYRMVDELIAAHGEYLPNFN